MGVDVKEIESWGLDWYTIRNLTIILPTNLNDATTGKFIEEKLNRAMQAQGSNGWDIKRSLRLIINDTSNIYNENDKLFAQQLLKLILIHRQDIDAFRVHSKGIGVICICESGIKKNELIHEYFGEIYPPWRWYEKQDIIKKGQNEGVYF